MSRSSLSLTCRIANQDRALHTPPIDRRRVERKGERERSQGGRSVFARGSRASQFRVSRSPRKKRMCIQLTAGTCENGNERTKERTRMRTARQRPSEKREVGGEKKREKEREKEKRDRGRRERPPTSYDVRPADIHAVYVRSSTLFRL